MLGRWRVGIPELELVVLQSPHIDFIVMSHPRNVCLIILSLNLFENKKEETFPTTALRPHLFDCTPLSPVELNFSRSCLAIARKWNAVHANTQSFIIHVNGRIANVGEWEPWCFVTSKTLEMS